MAECTHASTIRAVRPSARGCEECLKAGSPWVHLRICRACGHVGCCDQSPGQHATKHYRATHHPIIEGYDPPEGWGYCYIDDAFIDLGDDTTPQDGPIPRYVWRQEKLSHLGFRARRWASLTQRIQFARAGQG